MTTNKVITIDNGPDH